MRKLTLATTAAALALAVMPASASAVDVCNEAENSHRGGYVITDTPDPNPPAFLRGEQMRVGNGHGKGLERAGERSPALQVCGTDGSDGGVGAG
jgi:hypothetical protein